MSKGHTNLSSNQTIREAIKRIALHGVVNSSTGVIKDTGRIIGYVAKIHTEGDLAGTIDVQEYSGLSIADTDNRKLGYHEGVYLSALQDNSNGLLIVPKMYSEVVVFFDPESNHEYVSMFSHVDIIQLDSHEKVVVGVTEREEFDESDEDSPDVQNLVTTGVFARTTYLKDSAVTEVQGEEQANHAKQTIGSTKIYSIIGDDKSSTVIDQEKIRLKHGKAESTLDDDSNTMRHGASSVIIKDDTVFLGSESGTDDAVLGGALADIMMDMLNYISQIKTTTQLGPQPPLNVAQFIALKTKISAFKSSHSGFLTNKVQVQK